MAIVSSVLQHYGCSNLWQFWIFIDPKVYIHQLRWMYHSDDVCWVGRHLIRMINQTQTFLSGYVIHKMYHITMYLIWILWYERIVLMSPTPVCKSYIFSVDVWGKLSCQRGYVWAGHRCYCWYFISTVNMYTLTSKTPQWNEKKVIL